MSYKKHNFKSGQTLYAAELNEMDEQIALMDIALSKFEWDGTDLSDYSLIGNTPQILSGSNTEYSIILDATEETTVSIVSDTVTDLESSNIIKF